MGLGCGVGLSLCGLITPLPAAQKQCWSEPPLTAPLPLCSLSLSSSPPSFHFSSGFFEQSHPLLFPLAAFFFYLFLSLILSRFSSSSSPRQPNTKYTNTYTHTALVLITRQYLLSYGLTGSGYNVAIALCQSMLFYSD